MKKIAVLTYPIKHRKTYDVLSLLKANGYKDVLVCGIPFSYEKKKYPVIQHRPEMLFSAPELPIMCKNLGYKYQEGKIDDFTIEAERIVLIAGAGIIPNEFVQRHTIINAHPGYIPNCRGLDAFKWAIVEKQPIGVSTHLLGEDIDAGDVIERRIIDVNMYDTFHAVAQRVYENEVSMLIEAIEQIDNKGTTFIETGKFPLHKRMPNNLEKNLFELFEQYKVEFSKE